MKDKKIYTASENVTFKKLDKNYIVCDLLMRKANYRKGLKAYWERDIKVKIEDDNLELLEEVRKLKSKTPIQLLYKAQFPTKIEFIKSKAIALEIVNDEILTQRATHLFDLPNIKIPKNVSVFSVPNKRCVSNSIKKGYDNIMYFSSQEINDEELDKLVELERKKERNTLIIITGERKR